eukprot:SAG25_NODE_12553_length_278_cov_0.865922_1_plen_57_part_10
MITVFHMSDASFCLAWVLSCGSASASHPFDPLCRLALLGMACVHNGGNGDDGDGNAD